MESKKLYICIISSLLGPSNFIVIGCNGFLYIAKSRTIIHKKITENFFLSAINEFDLYGPRYEETNREKLMPSVNSALPQSQKKNYIIHNYDICLYS